MKQPRGPRRRRRRPIDPDQRARLLTEFERSDLSAAAYRLLESGATQQALALFRLGVEAFPDSAEAYDALGDACMSAERPEAARVAFERSLEIDPLDSFAFDMLGMLRAAEAAPRD